MPEIRLPLIGSAPLERLAPLTILLACVAALGGALASQYGLGLKPCILCLYQRGPYTIAALLAGLALWPGLSLPRIRLLLAVCALAFTINSGIAFFHNGVEQHWWTGTAACLGGGPALPTTPEQMLAQLAGPPAPRCDQIPWTLFGLSMAAYNIPASLCLAGFAAWVVRRLGCTAR